MFIIMKSSSLQTTVLVTDSICLEKQRYSYQYVHTLL